jgi:cell fate regulator YaaT (PSP1 superfamily)
MTSPEENKENQIEAQRAGEEKPLSYYRIRFRPKELIHTACSRISNLRKGEIVMVRTDHGPEPATVLGPSTSWPESQKTKASVITRRASREETGKLENLADMESKTFAICNEHIKKLNLSMRLVKVERFFNGSKIIFYFTAESRVDFRELVKNLVQEFRTRVEMRQIGVRHETKMIGGLGCCGRELCCSSFIKNFDSVSIKMAKAQNLPLNPSKISGACNRLLCCLNYEFDTYQQIRKGLPKIGKRITIDGVQYKVRRHNVLQESIVAVDQQGEEKTFAKEQWQHGKTTNQPQHSNNSQ